MRLGWLSCALSLSVAAAGHGQQPDQSKRATPAAHREVVVGSKKFTESVLLGELATAMLAAQPGSGAPPVVTHRRELGGTQVLWKALQRGDIDVYPEYTGTLAQELLHVPGAGLAELRRLLQAKGLEMTAPLGFNNTYAMGMRRARATELGLARLSDLPAHPDLRLGLTAEFMRRADGWPSLRARYRLPHTDVRGMDHDLAYRGLSAGTLDAIDLYSTDAEIAYYDLLVLEDDLGHFPAYEAVLLMRADLPAPVLARLSELEGRIDADRMRSMNAAVKLSRQPDREVAARFLLEQGLVAARGSATVETPSVWSSVAQRTFEHLALVSVSLLAGILLAVPLGVLAARKRRLSQLVLGVSGVLQTVPSLALLVMLIPVLGIGTPPAIATLFLYSLLPIVRNTYAGIVHIEPGLRDAALSLGLSDAARLRHVELPLAAPSILAGIKTAAVINVGTATLGALVGAGGYGQPILTGIRLDDTALILQGAVPAAGLALLVQGAFDGMERLLMRRR